MSCTEQRERASRIPYRCRSSSLPFARILPYGHTAIRLDAYGAIIGANIHAALPRRIAGPTFLPALSSANRQHFAARVVTLFSTSVPTDYHDS